MFKYIIITFLSFSLIACADNGESEPNTDKETINTDEETDNSSESSCTDEIYTILSASDDGSSEFDHTPDLTIDNDTSDESRWSSEGIGKEIIFDLGAEKSISSLKLIWLKGNERKTYFDIETSTNAVTWAQQLTNQESSGKTDDFEIVNLTESVNAQYVKLVGLGNSSNDWNSLIEIDLHKCQQKEIEEDETPTSTVTYESTIDNWDMSIWDLEGGDNDINPIDGDIMLFDALAAQHVTPNGNGWRHELKIKSSARVAMTEVYEDFQANIKLDISTGSKMIIAQHHASDTGTIMKLYVSDSSESGFDDSIANNGIFDVYVRLAKEDGSGEEKAALGTIVSGDNFDFQVINDYGYVTVSASGINSSTNESWNESFSLTIEDSSESYLKFGNYLQAQDAETRSNVDDSSDWAQFYQNAGITLSELTFSNITYLRTVSD